MKAERFQVQMLTRAFLISVALALPVSANEITPDDLEPVGPRNEAYEDAIWGQRIQSEVVYLRPSVAFEPDQRVRVQVPEVEDTDTSSRATRFVMGVVLAAILAAIIYVFVVNANGVGVSFRDTTENRRRMDVRRDKAAEDSEATQPLDQFLVGLAAMADKREALILLVSRALEWAADIHSLRLGRSQTARDVLHVLPVDWDHLPAMRGLVREAEIVHFGGREITQERWEECLAAARPIFAPSDGRAA